MRSALFKGLSATLSFPLRTATTTSIGAGLPKRERSLSNNKRSRATTFFAIAPSLLFCYRLFFHSAARWPYCHVLTWLAKLFSFHHHSLRFFAVRRLMHCLTSWQLLAATVGYRVKIIDECYTQGRTRRGDRDSRRRLLPVSGMQANHEF